MLALTSIDLLILDDFALETMPVEQSLLEPGSPAG